MIITITGLPGSGKSTIGKMLAQKLGYTFISMGDLRGKLAVSKGLTIEQLNALGEKEDWTDKLIDEEFKQLATQDNLVIDSRVAFHFIPDSFKVFLTVAMEEGAKRILHQKRDDESYSHLQETILALEKRINSDALRYKKYYGFDFRDEKHYDIILDTTITKEEETLNKIMNALA
ncbi:hypothetical protein C4573_05285 [Candidatus Woesearchaeota archaeon]|nr:MAG: hypothetical protein C4573_05285 [Candidatus Woesearchaeota archaeon]